MPDKNSYWNMLRLNWFRKPVEKTVAEPAIFAKQIEFADGTTIDLVRDSIVVLTGPNNVGKS